jgi:hypothetical protein
MTGVLIRELFRGATEIEVGVAMNDRDSKAVDYVATTSFVAVVAHECNG